MQWRKKNISFKCSFKNFDSSKLKKKVWKYFLVYRWINFIRKVRVRRKIALKEDILFMVLFCPYIHSLEIMELHLQCHCYGSIYVKTFSTILSCFYAYIGTWLFISKKKYHRGNIKVLYNFPHIFVSEKLLEIILFCLIFFWLLWISLTIFSLAEKTYLGLLKAIECHLLHPSINIFSSRGHGWLNLFKHFSSSEFSNKSINLYCANNYVNSFKNINSFVKIKFMKQFVATQLSRICANLNKFSLLTFP